MKDLGIYVHIPFCAAKCRYCDYYSITAGDSLRSLYLDAMIDHFETTMKETGGRTVDTIYIGGGTPSIFSAGLIERLVYGIRGFEISEKYEMTMEANPGTLDNKKVHAMKRSGVNRISLGAQSFCDGELETLGRIHDSDDTRRAFKMLRRHGFDNINLDILFAFPGQTAESFDRTLKEACRLDPEHISVYPLKIEKNTEFGVMRDRGLLEEFDEGLDREMYHHMIEYLGSRGYIHYEISNFSKKGKESIHNMKYWQMSDYIGFGAAAHSFIDNKRYRNQNDIYGYITDPAKKFDTVEYTMEDRIKEAMMLGFRMVKGINRTDFMETYKTDPYMRFEKEIDELKDQELIVEDGDNIRLTQIGLDHANRVFIKFV